MVNYSKIVGEVISESDILLIVLDARNVVQSTNADLERRIIKWNKKFLYVINKCDLLGKEQLDSIKIMNSIKVSAKNNIGKTALLKRIMMLARGKESTVGVVGLPNTGKSTVINMLKGQRSAPTSPISGYTKNLQKVRINSKIMLIDSPGIFSLDADRASLIAIGSIDASKIKDPESAAIELIKTMDGRIEGYYGVNGHDDPLDTLEEIAMKKSLLKKGGIPDIVRIANEILMLCQRGKIK